MSGVLGGDKGAYQTFKQNTSTEMLRQMAKFQIYGIGAALVDTEVFVSDEFLKQNQIEKGVMTLVSESRQAELLNAFSADKRHCNPPRK